MRDPRSFFQAGGTLGFDSPSYIERPADGELLEAVVRGDLCLVLAPRQTGKSSLVSRCLKRLEERSIPSAFVDFQARGRYNDEAQWFGNIVVEIGSWLPFQGTIPDWWAENAHLSAPLEFIRFFEVLLEQSPAERLVFFMDEIDSILDLPFSVISSPACGRWRLRQGPTFAV